MGLDEDRRRSASNKLRRGAEEKLKAKAHVAHSPRADVETQRLYHELQVHQIELEMQNAELRQVRDELEAALEKYGELYDFAPVGYFTLDRDGVVRGANIAGADLLGMERARLPGQRFERFVADDARLVCTEFLARAFAGQCKDSCEVWLAQAGDFRRFVRIEAVVVATRQECLVAVIDITAHKQTEELIQRNMEEVQAINQELNRFNRAAVARELRMIELKQEVNALCVQSGQKRRYSVDLEAQGVGSE